ncbi:GNAT family N-acetyltransferase [archaeon]|jgi:hypothetical protein|nr:GNAT family N-acetyltransferase [archaeon]MBT6956366.1 GNAT family N-acetyltransferase [archaeon]MBT7128655.1 GNAT family N-acetyltransferase [archaeon]
MKNKLHLRNIEGKNIGSLASVYKEVFSGHPWHEDLACDNCGTPYASELCERYDLNKEQKVVNDCRNGYTLRNDVFLLPKGGLDSCVECEKPLELVDFYPNFVNHQELIDEALDKEGFEGFMLYDENRPIGFSWGYMVPDKKTTSVNFPKVKDLLNNEGFVPNKTFYGAESGIIDSYQNRGLGSVLVAKRLEKAAKRNFEHFVNRTINPAMGIITSKTLSGKPPRDLFKDPERNSKWFGWDIKNLDQEYLTKVMDRLGK